MASRKTDPAQNAWEEYVHRNDFTRYTIETAYRAFKAGYELAAAAAGEALSTDEVVALARKRGRFVIGGEK